MVSSLLGSQMHEVAGLTEEIQASPNLCYCCRFNLNSQYNANTVARLPHPCSTLITKDSLFLSSSSCGDNIFTRHFQEVFEGPDVDQVLNHKLQDVQCTILTLSRA